MRGRCPLGGVRGRGGGEKHKERKERKGERGAAWGQLTPRLLINFPVESVHLQAEFHLRGRKGDCRLACHATHDAPAPVA